MAKFSSTNQPEKNGRPKGHLNMSTIIRQIWLTPVKDIKEDINDAPKIRFVKSVVAIAKKAEKGDVNAFKALGERMDGMPKQTHDVIQRGRFEEFNEISDEEILRRVKGIEKK